MIKQPPAALAKLWSCPWWCFGFVRLPVLSPYSDQVISWPRWICCTLVRTHACADNAVLKRANRLFKETSVNSQYAIRTAGDSVLIWRRGLSCQGSCLWLVDDGRCQIEWELCTMKHGKTDCQTLPILSVACYSVLSLLPLHSSALLSRCLTDDPDAWPRAILAGWPCRESAHSSYREEKHEILDLTLYELAPLTSKLCVMAFRFTLGGVYDDLRLKWLNEHCSLSKDEKNDTFGEL